MASSLFFAVGSILAAVSKNFTMMLVGRTIQGIGGGGIMTLGEILVTDLVPLSVRGGMFFFPFFNRVLVHCCLLPLSLASFLPTYTD